MAVKVSLVEDNHELRKSFVTLFNGAPGLCCVGAYGSGEEALEKIPLTPPDVVLMDINLPGMDGVECAARLKNTRPDVSILMLTLYDRSDLILNALRAGARGYLLKSVSTAELVNAVEQVHAGGSAMSASVARKVVDYFYDVEEPASQKLTPREQKILELLAKGHLYREIGEDLEISPSTVRSHVHAIYTKLHVESRQEAVAKFLKYELNSLKEFCRGSLGAMKRAG